MIAIIACGSNKVPMIENMVQSLGFESITFPLNKIHIFNPDNFDKVIISGAPILLSELDPLPYLEKFSWIKRHTEKPILGICFGHQILGMLYGAKIFRIPEVRSDEQIEMTSPSILFEGLTSSFIMNEDHCEAITLPKEFQLIASSKSCELEGMQHLSYPWYGVQFHPETSKENGKALFKNFLSL